jgi:hypothetical protein
MQASGEERERFTTLSGLHGLHQVAGGEPMVRADGGTGAGGRSLDLIAVGKGW